MKSHTSALALIILVITFLLAYCHSVLLHKVVEVGFVILFMMNNVVVSAYIIGTITLLVVSRRVHETKTGSLVEPQSKSLPISRTGP